MKRFLVIEQDLRVSGTSQGIISRSFLAKLRKAYPTSKIDVVYIKKSYSDDELELLPVDHIHTHVLDIKIPFLTLWLNKLYWRMFHISLKELYIEKQYSKIISKTEPEKYDHIFVRSAGLDHENILALKGLPILKKAIVNFHDPYPLFWYVGSKKELDSIELFRMKRMWKVVREAKTCMSSANTMSRDLELLYGSQKKFHVLPHQFDGDVFNKNSATDTFTKSKKVTISYHGAIQFGRNMDILLDAYQELIEEHPEYERQSEFVARLKSSEFLRIKNKYASTSSIHILEGVEFSTSRIEQEELTDINIILENGPEYCNILVGKAPMLVAMNKTIFCLSPPRSELREIIENEMHIASSSDKEEIKRKLKFLIAQRLSGVEHSNPFGNYFSVESFKLRIDLILAS